MNRSPAMSKGLGPASTHRVLIGVLWGAAAVGILLRLWWYLDPRDLIIDEANVVRNLAERDFAGLLRPLAYEQFAPPLFLWAAKLSALWLGYGERALWLPALVCGTLSLAAMLAVARQLLPPRSAIYPVVVFAAGGLFVEYSAMLKQYGGDALMTLALLLVGLHAGAGLPQKLTTKRALFVWAAGAVAMVCSMPAAFMLAGLGGYLFWRARRSRRAVFALLLVGAAWAVQFGLYYYTVLRPQATSAFLQQWHNEYFLYAVPRTSAEWRHNGGRAWALVGAAFGYSGLSLGVGATLLVLGILTLIRRRPALLWLLLVPVLAMLAAAAARQWSLIERVSLGCLPLLILIAGFGAEAVMRRLRSTSLRLAFGTLCLTAALLPATTTVRKIVRPTDRIRTALSVMANRRPNARVYVHHSSVPQFYYYTRLHPGAARWAALRRAHSLRWNDDYGSIRPLGHPHEALYFFAAGLTAEERAVRLAQWQQSWDWGSIYRFRGSGVLLILYHPKVQPQYGLPQELPPPDAGGATRACAGGVPIAQNSAHRKTGW